MSLMGPAFLALAVAAVTTALGLITSKYPRTFFVLTVRGCPALYIYSSIYGFIAWFLTCAGIPQIQAFMKVNSWLGALAIGLSTKAFLHIRLFSIPASAAEGAETVPVGLETLVHTFEPWFLRTIESDELNGVHAFLAPWLTKYRDLASIDRGIKASLPKRLLSTNEYASFQNALQLVLNGPECHESEKVCDVLEIYLRYLGRKSLLRIFPLDTVQLMQNSITNPSPMMMSQSNKAGQS